MSHCQGQHQNRLDMHFMCLVLGEYGECKCTSNICIAILDI